MLADPLPAGFLRRIVELSPGQALPYVASEWEDSLVIVHRGVLELECLAGGRRSFARGSVLSLGGLGLRFLRNSGQGVLVLMAISRRPMSSARARRLSSEPIEET